MTPKVIEMKYSSIERLQFRVIRATCACRAVKNYRGTAKVCNCFDE